MRTTLFFSFIIHVFEEIDKQRQGLKEQISQEVEPTDQGKRQVRLEKFIYTFLKREIINELKSMNIGVRLNVEGYGPVENGLPVERVINVDPWDGTANGCRWFDAGQQIGSPFATVISIMPEMLNPTFGDVQIGAGLDLRTGQFWIAETGVGAYSGLASNPAGTQTRLKPNPQYHRHSPLLASEFYRQINWATRLLINQPVEWADCASSFINMLRVALGETDCYFNNLLPGFSDEGQRGHELGAMMPFIAELGAYAWCTSGEGRPLTEAPFDFDGMTPVIIGVDKATVQYYQAMITRNLAAQIQLTRSVGGEPGITFRLADIIPAIIAGVGTDHWSLRNLPDPAKQL